MRRVFLTSLLFFGYPMCSGCIATFNQVSVPKELDPWVRIALVKMHSDPRVAENKHIGNIAGVKEILEEFAKIGALMGADGKLYSSEGKEVYLWVWMPTGGGVYGGTIAGPDQTLLAELGELKKRYQVVELKSQTPLLP